MSERTGMRGARPSRPFAWASIEGVRELRGKFAALPRAVQRQTLLKAARAGASPVRDRARELAPRDTGGLAQKGIGTRITASRTTYAEVSVALKKGYAYGIVQEFGRSASPSHPAQPFMRPAFDEKKDESIEIAAGVLRREIIKVAR